MMAPCFRSTVATAILILAVASSWVHLTKAELNVLFLIADDLRPELGSYDNSDFPSVHPDVLTPNIDYLASASLLLERAHCQAPLCNPSRSSVLTGRRPETTHIYGNSDGDFRERGGDFCTIPQYFKDRGYLSIGMGKIFHPREQDPPSWSDPVYTAPNKGHWDSHNASWNAVPPSDREQRPLPDEQIRDYAIETLRLAADNATSGVQPFFVAVGFYKPHLPFTFPEEYLDLYPSEEVVYPPNPYAPDGMPTVAWSNYGELRDYDDIAALEEVTGDYNTSLPDDVMMDLRRAYVSAVTYVDDLIGEILDELEDLGLAETTIVSFWGDHGWSLGEHSEWCKRTLLDRSSHVPTMIRVPGLTTEGGIVTDELTELVDLFPTLAETAGLDVPPLCPEDSSNVYVCREGDSLMPLISNPADPSWKKMVFTETARSSNTIMGYSIRTERYRYSEWVDFNETGHLPDWDISHGIELYDHQLDSLEDVNVVDDPIYEDIIEELSEQLRAGWREVVGDD